MAMHKSKEYWGEDADIVCICASICYIFLLAVKWDPDRFLDERNQRVVANPFIFLPFSAGKIQGVFLSVHQFILSLGPRICLGQQVSLVQSAKLGPH
jgi:hypothetical protein